MVFTWNLEEISSFRKEAPTIRQQFLDIWRTLQLQAVYKPISFIFIYYALQIPNQAWSNFLVVGLHFSDFEIGLLTVSSTVFLWIGMILFKQYFFDTSWRRIYIWTTILSFAFSLLQILLILRLNTKLGAPDVVFALGDTGIVYLVYAIQSMPSSIMFIMILPEGINFFSMIPSTTLILTFFKAAKELLTLF